MKLIWEEVEPGMNRAPVPGGWIVQQYDQRYNERAERWDWMLISAFFVPDTTHAWVNTANNRAVRIDGPPRDGDTREPVVGRSEDA